MKNNFYEKFHNQSIYYVYMDISDLIISANNFIVNETFSAKYIGVETPAYFSNFFIVKWTGR